MDELNLGRFKSEIRRDHGTIVDFVQRRGGATLGAVRRELQPWIGGQRSAPPPEAYILTVARQVADRAAVARVFETARTATNSTYLNTRAIAHTILCSDRFAGTFRDDRRGSVLFPHRDEAGLSGFEPKNRGWTSYSAGGVRALWSSNAFSDDRHLVLVESAIDAPSFHQAHAAPRVRYASTAGTVSQRQRGLLAAAIEALPAGMFAVLAFNRDAVGDRLAEQVRVLAAAEFSRACPPIGKDWNDYLQLRERLHGPAVAPVRGRRRKL